MKFILLTHERELEKKNNTGAVVRGILKGDCELVVWKRREPDESLLSLLARQQAAVLFPREELPTQNTDSPGTYQPDPQCLFSYTHYVILDATWQQAKKMYRQSPYLQQADKFSLDNVTPSTFVRRGNQLKGGLCTAECVIELLELAGESESASELAYHYEAFNRALPS